MTNKIAGETIFAETYRDESRGLGGDIPITKDNGKIDQSFLGNAIPKWLVGETYSEDDMIAHARALWASNGDANIGNEPGTGTASIADLNAGYYTDTTLAGSQSYGMCFNADGTKMYMSDSNNVVYQFSLSTPYLPTTASYDSKSFSFNSVETGLSGIRFNDDGTKFYIIGFVGDIVRQYTIGTAWDISTASASSTFSVSGQDAVPRDLTFNGTGTKMYIMGDNSNTIYQYDLSTGFDISTASYIGSFSVSSQAGDGYGLDVSPDGSKIIVQDYNDQKIYRYTMATPGDITTCIFDQVYAHGISSVCKAIFNNDGTRVALLWVTKKVSYLDLGEAYDFNGVRYTGKTFDASGQETNLYGMTIAGNGTKAYIVGTNNDTVYQYNLGTAWDIDTATYVGGLLSVSAQDTAPRSIKFSEDGTKFYMLGQNEIIYQYNLGTAWDITTASYASKSLTVSGQDSENYGFTLNATGTRVVVSGRTNDTLYQYTLSTPWDMSTGSYDSVSKAITDIYGIDFNSDGTLLYGVTSSLLYVYELSTPYSISTLTLKGVIDLTGIATSIFAVYVKPNDISIFIASQSNDDLYELELSTANEISLASASYQFINGGGTPVAMFVSQDGKTAYRADQSAGRVYDYKLSTPWDLTTAVAVTNFYFGGTLRGLAFSLDGLVMIRVETHNMYQYDLSTAWDISTAVYVRVNNTSGSPLSIGGNKYTSGFSPDGKIMYLCSSDGKVYGLSLSTAYDISTLALDKNFVTGGSPYAIQWSPDGSRAFILYSTNAIKEYTAGTPWDVSTLADSGNELAGVTSAGYNFSLKPDGKALFHGGNGDDTLTKYKSETGIYGLWSKIT